MKPIKQIIIFLFLLLSCGSQDINNPNESNNKKYSSNADTIKCNTIILGKASQIYGAGNMMTDLHIDSYNLTLGAFLTTIKGNTSFADGKFVINSGGQLITINNLSATDYKDYQIISDGKMFTPKRIARWRGELNSDPENGVSGDTYWNIPNKEKRIYIAIENKWIKD